MFNGREKGRVAWSSHDKWVHGACRAVLSFIATVQPIKFGLAFLFDCQVDFKANASGSNIQIYNLLVFFSTKTLKH